MADERELDDLNLEVLSSTAQALGGEDAFDAMVESWDRRLSVPPARDSPANLTALMVKLQTMMQLLQSRTHRALGDDLARLVHQESGASAVLTGALAPLHFNAEWAALCAGLEGGRFDFAVLDADDSRHLAQMLEPDAATQSCLVRIAEDRTDIRRETVRFFLVERLASDAEGSRDPDAVVLHLRELAIGWSDVLGVLLAEAYGLSDAECKVAQMVLAGERPETIAALRGASIATVRKQIQSLLRKSTTQSQVELVQLLSLVASNLDRPRGPMAYEWSDPWQSERQIIRPGGHRLAYSEAGVRGGMPVLIVHGEGIGYALPHILHEHAAAHGWHLYAIQRPGHGNSDLGEGETGFSASTAAVGHLCNAIIGKPAVIIAMHCAIPVVLKLLHDRTIVAGRVVALNAILSLIGGIDNRLPPVQRAWFRLARMSKKAAVLATNAGWALVRKNGAEWYFEKYFADSPADLVQVRRASVRRLLQNSAAMMLRQGPATLIEDILHYLEPAGDFLPLPDTAVSFVFGKLNPLFDPAIIADLERASPGLSTLAIDDGGELIAYSHLPEILDHITADLAR